MKILSLRISNILSFKHFTDITNSSPIVFDGGLNIIIGENGAGKSTALEVINFLFKKVLLKQFPINEEMVSNRKAVDESYRKSIVKPIDNSHYHAFRLDPNWNSTAEAQKIRIEIALDTIDRNNIRFIQENLEKLNGISNLYSTIAFPNDFTTQETYIIDVQLNEAANKSFTVSHQGHEDFGISYLLHYNYYKQLIRLYNLDNSLIPLAPLNEAFTLIGGYRNYNTFDTSIRLNEHLAPQQIEAIDGSLYIKSLNTNDLGEPTIFKIVRLRVAEYHFNLLQQKLSENEREDEANNLQFIKSINDKLRIINLRCRIKLVNQQSWQYSFSFFDIKRNQELGDINSLSAGQKAIIHLIFEAFGRGDVKGGVIIIDEPEIHLHYQFQHEYMKILNQLNKEQNCQYILVTHSEALINSSTIHHVKRFSLSQDGYTIINAPKLTQDQKTLIKILDNTRTTYAFFAKKILLVEGDNDRYFFKSIIQAKHPSLDQEIAVLHMGGKGELNKWRMLFQSFGLDVYFIGDFDCLIDQNYPNAKGTKLTDDTSIVNFKVKHTDWEANILLNYTNNIFILKNGDLEHYLGVPKKDLISTIDFCNKRLVPYLNDTQNLESVEIGLIIGHIIH